MNYYLLTDNNNWESAIIESEMDIDSFHQYENYVLPQSKYHLLEIYRNGEYDDDYEDTRTESVLRDTYTHLTETSAKIRVSMQFYSAIRTYSNITKLEYGIGYDFQNVDVNDKILRRFYESHEIDVRYGADKASFYAFVDKLFGLSKSLKDGESTLEMMPVFKNNHNNDFANVNLCTALRGLAEDVGLHMDFSKKAAQMPLSQEVKITKLKDNTEYSFTVNFTYRGHKTVKAKSRFMAEKIIYDEICTTSGSWDADTVLEN